MLWINRGHCNLLNNFHFSSPIGSVHAKRSNLTIILILFNILLNFQFIPLEKNIPIHICLRNPYFSFHKVIIWMRRLIIITKRNDKNKFAELFTSEKKRKWSSFLQQIWVPQMNGNAKEAIISNLIFLD